MAEGLGVLYGVGVGPGDPGLITVKAVRVLERVSKIFAASSTKNDYSLAQRVVQENLADVSIEQLAFPMTRDEQVLLDAWHENALRVLEVLQDGRDAAFVTLGDPLTYSTFSYLLRTMKELAPDVDVVAIPGITAYQAAAAVSRIPLAEGEESLHLISGVEGGDKLRTVIEASENVVMLKTYRNFSDIYTALEELDLLDKAVYVGRCGLEGETVVEDLRALKGERTPYLSLIIIKKKGILPAAGEMGEHPIAAAQKTKA
ncbi:MAG: precorrin-2 C(20)-methyltransferase [Deltaproteobacteria bacterium]